MRNLNIIEDFDATIIDIEANFEKSTFDVLVVASFKKDGEEFRIVKFPTDLNTFGMIAAVISTRCQLFPKLTMQLLTKLADMGIEEVPNNDSLCPLILKCICVWEEASRIYATLPDQSIGFRLTIDLDNLQRSKLWGGTEAEVKADLDRMLNNNQN